MRCPEASPSPGQGGAVVSWRLWIVVGLAVVFMVGVGMAARAMVMDVARNVRVGDVLKDHDAELRRITGVEYLGTHSGSGEPAHIVVYVAKVTPEIRAAVPATLDGYRVDVEAVTVLPPEPPLLLGEVTSNSAATPEQAAAGIAGVLKVKGDLFKTGHGKSAGRTLLVRVPTSVHIWRPQGEGKEFIAFADVLVGDTVAATLTAIPGANARRATAGDLEVYLRE
jgi:hypothetical protein